MTTKCYGIVRGSAIRVTGLGSRGQIPDPIQYVVSKSVAKVTINEVADTASNETFRNETDDPRLLFVQSDQTIRYSVDVDFLRVDPELFWLVSGVTPRQRGVSYGFGEGPFGEGPFGEAYGAGETSGFDSVTRKRAVSFALEVWTRLDGSHCPDPLWGYSVFPFLKGGYLSGFAFSNGSVSFRLRGAQARKASRWGVGPYDLEGVQQRLLSVVSRNLSFRQTLTTGAPPAETCGIVETEDVIDGGTASVTTSDVIEGWTAYETTPWIVEGGRAL